MVALALAQMNFNLACLIFDKTMLVQSGQQHITPVAVAYETTFRPGPLIQTAFKITTKFARYFGYCGFANIVAFGHKELKRPLATISLSVISQMSFPLTRMNCGSLWM